MNDDINPESGSTPNTPTNIAEYKKRRQGITLSLPSGFVMICRRAELRTLLSGGSLPNSLISIVEEALNKGKEIDVKELMSGPEGQFNLDKVNDMYDMVNLVVMATVVDPKIHPEPTHDDLLRWNNKNPENKYDDIEDLRSDDLLYIDEVDDEDKMFLFQWSSGGTADVAKFREEAESDLVAMASGQNLGGPTQ